MESLAFELPPEQRPERKTTDKHAGFLQPTETRITRNTNTPLISDEPASISEFRPLLTLAPVLALTAATFWVKYVNSEEGPVGGDDPVNKHTHTRTHSSGYQKPK
jgi:hypothetical protein